MFRKKKATEIKEFPVPAKLPPLEEMDEQVQDAPVHHRRTWLWTLGAALIVVTLMVYVLGLGAKGFLDGLKDRGIENQQIAQEHYALGLAHLEGNDYEMAIA
jgi:hypothetical protein